MKQSTIGTALFFLSLSLGLSACPGTGSRGWSQADKDKLIGACVTSAKQGGPGLDEAKITSYCTCYQQNLEKKYPKVTDMAPVKAEDISKEAEKCLELMFK